MPGTSDEAPKSMSSTRRCAAPHAERTLPCGSGCRSAPGAGAVGRAALPVGSPPRRATPMQEEPVAPARRARIGSEYRAARSGGVGPEACRRRRMGSRFPPPFPRAIAGIANPRRIPGPSSTSLRAERARAPCRARPRVDLASLCSPTVRYPRRPRPAESGTGTSGGAAPIPQRCQRRPCPQRGYGPAWTAPPRVARRRPGRPLPVIESSMLVLFRLPPADVRLTQTATRAH
jgi:hypothetical protein